MIGHLIKHTSVFNWQEQQMGDENKIDLTDLDFGNISIDYSDTVTLSGLDVNYDKWLEDYIGNIHIDDYDYSLIGPPGLGANDIKLTGGGQEMLRIAEDGFYVNGVKVKQGKREAKAVYEAFKKWMTHAIMSGELNN